MKAKENIERALGDWVNDPKRRIVRVNEWGHLDIFLGSEKFDGKNVSERVDMVWDFLRKDKQLAWEDLSLLSNIHAWTCDEFDQRFSNN